MVHQASHVLILLTSALSSLASPLGMPHGAATFVGTCSGDQLNCDSGVSVPEVLEGERSVSQGAWGRGVEAGGLMWVCAHTLLVGNEELESTERACDTLLMCIVTVMNHGLRNGGGVGDILRKPSKDVSIPGPTPRSMLPKAWPSQPWWGPALRSQAGRASSLALPPSAVLLVPTMHPLLLSHRAKVKQRSQACWVSPPHSACTPHQLTVAALKPWQPGFAQAREGMSQTSGGSPATLASSVRQGPSPHLGWAGWGS